MSTRRLARWRLRLSKSGFDVIHRAVKKPQASDALLQLSTTDKDENALKDELPLQSIANIKYPNSSNAPTQGNDHLDENINTVEATTDQQKNSSPTLV